MFVCCASVVSSNVLMLVMVGDAAYADLKSRGIPSNRSIVWVW